MKMTTYTDEEIEIGSLFGEKLYRRTIKIVGKFSIRPSYSISYDCSFIKHLKSYSVVISEESIGCTYGKFLINTTPNTIDVVCTTNYSSNEDGGTMLITLEYTKMT